MDGRKKFSEMSMDGCSVSPRKFVFLELFAGMGGFSRQVQKLCGDLVEVQKPLDQFGGWDVTSEDGMEQALQLCVEADFTHLAFPCRSFSAARRTDEHGSVPEVRSAERPDGWGHPVSEEGNEVLKRAIIVAFKMLDKQAFFAMENPESSYAWLVSFIQKLLKAEGVELVGLDQCIYGAPSVKPTGILSNTKWMLEVVGRCEDARPHAHLRGGLVGHMWDPASESWIWKTAKAAEYPQGLCRAWALALRSWLLSDVGRNYMARRTLVKVNKFQMIRLDMVKPEKHSLEMSPLPSSSQSGQKRNMSKVEIREQENLGAVGGLRDPRKAVARSSHLRRVGERIRAVMDGHLTDKLCSDFERELGVCDMAVLQC